MKYVSLWLFKGSCLRKCTSHVQITRWAHCQRQVAFFFFCNHFQMYISAFRADELTCGGMANQVRDAFAETMTSVVQLAARYPIACCNSIGLLCIIPYTR